MKMQQADYEKLAPLVKDMLEKNPQAKPGYIAKGLSFTRFAWDTWHAVSDKMQRENVEVYLWMRGLYDKLNDSHIETALRRIIGKYE